MTFDRSLSFRPHVKETVRKAERKMSLIRAVTNTSSGWRKKDLKKVWTAHVRSVLNYAAGGWQLWISNSLVEKLERVQNRGLRLITGQSMSSPCEALRAKATVNSMRCVIRQNIFKSKEKALRLPEDHPRRVAFEGVSRSRLKRRDAWSEAKNLCKE